jgi:parallel beta helix pectate lyase-like protein
VLKPEVSRVSPAHVRWAVLMLVGALALSTNQLERFRAFSPERLTEQEFIVTNPADSGAGSLREGIFVADRAPKRARIVLEVPSVIISTPLPPLVNPHGVVIDASRSRTRLIVTNGLAAGPVIDVAAPGSSLLGVRIAGAPEEAILVRSGGVRLRAIAVESSRIGVYIADGVEDVSVTESIFRGNNVAIQSSADAPQIVIQNNEFEGQKDASIWAVAPNPRPEGEPRLIVSGNRFSGDARSLVVINGVSRIDDNQISFAVEAGIYVSGAVTVIQGNHLRAGVGFGIEAADLAYGLIQNNEMDHHCSGGILLRSTKNTHVTGNRLYTNGSGVVVVHGDTVSPLVIDDNLITEHMLDGLHVIGASPVIRNNRLFRNHRSGIRVSTLLMGPRAVAANPRLDTNMLNGNGANEPQHDEYKATSAAPAADGERDCPWRQGRPVAQVAFTDPGR